MFTFGGDDSHKEDVATVNGDEEVMRRRDDWWNVTQTEN